MAFRSFLQAAAWPGSEPGARVAESAQAEANQRERETRDPSVGSVVTEQRWSEQENRKLNEDLERRVEERTAELRATQEDLVRNERLATLGQLTATVSHELRNPLGVIRTSAYTLRRNLPEESPRTQRALERIERSVVRCDRIIDELLDYTRISKLELEPTPLDPWLAGVLEDQELPSSIALRSDLGLPGISLSIDRDRLRRAIINVFDNACQAMLGDDELVSLARERVLLVRTVRQNGRIEIVFQDTGPGIPADVLPRIFEPLYSTKSFGVGLGLPVVKQIMEQHGGGVEIQTTGYAGTAVHLWMRSEGAVQQGAA